uniref:Conserved oligomeric Golgi complex subunit 5 n=1 Tax=Tetraselmis sp. GSL018 TaxID=582737 RepID=A0A061QRR0_9CHLO|mmetsp:Transcript_10036/g.23925  ORF Transcript_10036/g.23925 Transcript_10036/m.23925 type:complete len:796 (-) Transcript_10036:1248-3635(-)
MGRGAEGSVDRGSTPASLLVQERFRPFLEDDFDPSTFASATLARSASSAMEQVQELQGGIQQLQQQIREEVNAKYDELVSHSCKLRESEASLQGVRLSVESLKSAILRVGDEIQEPFESVQSRTHQLNNLLHTSDLLRHILQRIKITAKLRQQMLPADSKQGAATDLAKAAKFLTDAKAVGEEVDLAGLDILATDDEFLAQAELDLTRQAEAVLAKGMSSLSQAEVGSALQVYHNLNRLRDAVYHLISQYTASLSKTLDEALDLRRINASLRASQAPSSGSPSLGGASAVADEMWARIGRFGEELHSSAVAVWHLQRVLAKKRDPLSHQCFEDVVRVDGAPQLVQRFWSEVHEIMRGRLSAASKPPGGGRDPIRDTLGQSYPRLASMLEGTLLRLVRDTDIKGTAPAAGPDARDELLAATGPFFDAYLSGAKRRLSEAVSTAFPGGSGRPVPSAAEVQKLVGRLYDELKSASGSESLSIAVGARVGEVLADLAERAAHMAAAGPELRQLGGPAGPSQQRNIALCNSLQEVHRAVTGLMPRLPHPVGDALRSPLDAVRGAAVECVAPIFRRAVEDAEKLILSIHQESFGQAEGNYETATSPFVSDLSKSLSSLRTEILSRFSPPPSAGSQTFASALVQRMASRILVYFVRHASMIRLLGHAGKLRLTKDMAELEAAVNHSLLPVQQLGIPYRMLRAFRPLLFQESASLEGSALLKELPAPVVLHHLCSRAGPSVRTPMEQGGLTPSQWSLWLDQHSGAEAVSRFASALKDCEPAAEDDPEGVVPLMVRICDSHLGK